MKNLAVEIHIVKPALHMDRNVEFLYFVVCINVTAEMVMPESLLTESVSQKIHAQNKI
jgi:hypothetical protein